MKAVKFLTVFAMASMLVACVEDLTPVENVQQEMGQVVGGEVIGTDVSMVIPATGVETKYAGGKRGWDPDDKIGLGWLAQGNDEIGEDAKLYANHLFYVSEKVNEDGNRPFEARGNIYKGWHFAYFPYTYMENQGELTLDLNPAQTNNIVKEDGTSNPTEYYKRYAQKFQVSSLQKLTKESLVEPDYNQLRPEIDFTLFSPVSAIMFRTWPAEGSAFATTENMKNYKIKSVTLSVGYKMFATEATLDPSKLHKYDAEKDNAELLAGSFKNAFKAEYKNNISVDVTKAGYKVGSPAAAVAYTLPYYGKSIINNTTGRAAILITVCTDKGDFNIRYADGEDLPQWQKDNNAAIQSIANAYKAEVEGLEDYGIMKKNDAQLILKLYLHEDNFGLNWNVADENDWADKIALAADLKSVNPEFVLPEFVLVDNAEININEVEIPEGGVTLAGAGKLNVNADWTWDEGIKFATDSEITVEVAANKTLTVNSELAPKSLVNNGTIDAQAKAILNSLTNNGEVKVAYGSQVYPVDGASCGVISFVVPENYTRAMIENVTAVGYAPVTTPEVKRYANVNTLIVDGFEVDFHSSTTIPGTEGSSDPYAPTPGTGSSTADNQPFGTALSNINFVLNNATIKSTLSATTVKNVTMTNSSIANVSMADLTIVDGENTVEATAISGGVTVKAGKNDIKAVTITGNVEVKAGAGNITAETINGNININGNYTVKATSVTGNIEAKGENYFNEVPTINGNITLTNTANTGCALSGNTIDGNLTLTGEGFGLENVTVNTVTLKDGSVKVFNTTVKADFNVEKGNANIDDSSIAGTLTNAGTVTIKGETTMKNIVNNGTFTSYVDLVVENITLNPKSVTTLTSNGEDFDGTIWYTGAYENNNMTLNGAVVKYGYYGDLLKAEIAAATPGTTVTLKGDVQLGTFLTIDKDVTIDLKGKNITTVETWEEGGSNSYIFYVTGGGDLTLKGDGRVETAPSDYGMCVWAADGGKVTIEGGDYYSPGLETAACDCIYAKNGGVVIINGGKFGHSGPITNGGAVVNSHNSSPGLITVNGGTFYGTLVYEDGDIDNGFVVWGEGAVILE